MDAGLGERWGELGLGVVREGGTGVAVSQGSVGAWEKDPALRPRGSVSRGLARNW